MTDMFAPRILWFENKCLNNIHDTLSILLNITTTEILYNLRAIRVL